MFDARACEVSTGGTSSCPRGARGRDIVSPCRGQQAPPWMGALCGDSLGTPLTCLGRQRGWEDPKGWGLPSLFPSATPSAGALLLPSLRGQRCCDNQDGLIGPITAQHSPTGVTWVTATPQISPVLAMLDPSPSLGVQGQCHHHGIPEGTLPPHTPLCPGGDTLPTSALAPATVTDLHPGIKPVE